MLVLLSLGLVGLGSGHQAHKPAYGAGSNSQQKAAHDHAGSSFGAPQDLKDTEHIKSHLKDEINTEAEWSEEQVKFYYFKMFDSSRDNLLDGLEIYHAIRHNDEEHFNATKEAGKPTDAPLTEIEVEEQTDKILSDMDRNMDGFIAWPEFVEYVDRMGLAKA